MRIDLDNALKMQKITGFGTSSCWWSPFCKDNKAQKKIASLLYGDEGLGLNIYRYNVGAGFDPDNCRISNPWRRSESFYKFDVESETGEYDFSADKAAVDFMKKCLAHGNIDTLILFANSPHWSFTSSGQSSGSLLYHTCNLPKMNYKKYADYFLTITQHFIDEGLPVKYISPINEPQWKWGGPHIWQEGCHYDIEEVTEVFHIFAKEIKKRKIPVKLYGPESGEMGGLTKKYLKAFMADKDIRDTLGAFAYHSYHSDNKPKDRVKFKKELVNKNPKLRFDMSEWCELPNKSHTRNFKGALITARVIGQDLIYAGSSSWTSWVAVNQISIKDDGFDYSDGLMSASDDFSKWYINERYYALAHYSKYIPVGSVCLDISFFPDRKNDFNVSAFRTPSRETVLVIVNEGKEREIEIGGKFRKMKEIVSDKDSKLKINYDGGYRSVNTIESETITTLILK
ncbi:MAG: hypothetical protein K5761_07620 [Clostridiales bacterium]|nr:hypothetical protein [Clostridiales bacterium]